MDVLLKQRLVGALVLVALGVIFVPMLLEGPNRTLVPEMAALPEPGDPMISVPLESFPAPDAIPAEPDVAVVQADSQPVAVPENPAEVAQSDSAPEPVTEPEPVKPAPEPAVVAPEPDRKQAKPGPLGSWVVQMGSFSTEKNALRLRDKLRKNGFVTQVEKARVDGKSRFRVRVGPFLEKSDAEQSRQQIQDKLALKGRVLSYP